MSQVSQSSREMLARLRTKYDNLLILFVPANCTSELQPLDVSFNAPFKRLMRSSAVSWLADVVAARLCVDDLAPIDTTKRNLCSPFCAWVQQSLEKLSTDAGTLSRAWSVPGLSSAWDLSINDNLFARAVQLHETGKLWDVNVKEHPLLRYNEVDEESVEADADEGCPNARRFGR